MLKILILIWKMYAGINIIFVFWFLLKKYSQFKIIIVSSEYRTQVQGRYGAQNILAEYL